MHGAVAVTGVEGVPQLVPDRLPGSNGSDEAVAGLRNDNATDALIDSVLGDQ
ncbi:hypothetical protein D3C78_1969410 [compost metagenome]